MKKILGVTLVFCILACSSDSIDENALNCSLVDCASGEMVLQFFDAETAEDVFYSGEYDFNNLTITDVSTNEAYPFFTSTSQETESSFVALNPFFESREDVVLKIAVVNGFETDLSFDVTYFEGECCNGNTYAEVQFSEVDSVVASQANSFFKIYL